jgi:peptidyl-prolyl cis-trans isomerase C
MKRSILSLLALAAMPLVAQQQPPAGIAAAVSPADRPVAVVNGETITAGTLDQMYSRLGTQMREQYNASGGKAAFLENYLRKRLMVQEALKAGFDKRPDVQADMESAKESALFDRYVRDVVANSIVTDAMVKKYYEEHPDEFATPEKVKVRHIVILPNGAGPHPKSDQQALELIQKVATEIHAKFAGVRGGDEATQNRIRTSYFGELARQYSEDGSAPAGGDLGWVQKGQLDPDFEAAAFKLEKGLPSGIVKSRFGYHIILVEDKQPAGTESFDAAKASIREFLMTQHAVDVMQEVTRLTNELRGTSKIAVYPENIR